MKVQPFHMEPEPAWQWCESCREFTRPEDMRGQYCIYCHARRERHGLIRHIADIDLDSMTMSEALSTLRALVHTAQDIQNIAGHRS